jgi:hypothetical protein
MAGLSLIGTMNTINNQNDHAEANAQNAKIAANQEREGTDASYIEQHRSLIQGAFDSVIAGREAEATSYASAIENGVQGSSVKASLRSLRQKSDRNTARTSQEMKSLRSQTQSQYRHINAKATGRIASVPTTSFGLGDAATVLAPIVRGQME